MVVASAKVGVQADLNAWNRISIAPKTPSREKISLPSVPPSHGSDVAPTPSTTPYSRFRLRNLRRPKTSPSPKASPSSARFDFSEDERRDSALLPASPAGTTAPATPRTGSHELNRVASLPTLSKHRSRLQGEFRDESSDLESVPGQRKQTDRNDALQFNGITTMIPRTNFDDLSSINMQFSKRGSMLLDGKRAAIFADQTRTAGVQSPRAEVGRQLSPSMREGRVLSVDEISLSQRVRSMYEYGCERGADWTHPALTDQTVLEEESENETPPGELALSVVKNRCPDTRDMRRSPSFSTRRASFVRREPFERAGGIEDWEDVEGGEVDRYGFILPSKAESRASDRSVVPYESPHFQRMSTALVEISETPRRRKTARRTPARLKHSHGTPQRKISKHSRQPSDSIRSYQSTSSFSINHTPLRYAANRLPQNRDRRWMDEASDMLTLPPGLADIAAQEEGGKAMMVMKRKEWRREEKWRKMGRASQRSTRGGGTQFDFEPRDPKVIARTWKGIPDRWRASAWFSFLAASAKTRLTSPCEEELIEAFNSLQEENSADDVQIDCDVPRTINRHIMFRKRYRGGQRLLFRVLHALSLYFPGCGYVQGMATLAATLLCYYDEEQAFIMMVRLWQLRGLDRLYESGFGGLMEALDEFEREWLRGGDVAKKLEQHGIGTTAYGTRWYLTLFNYSIPFQAQLRVWDVFMLLGDVSNASDAGNSFGADLDVLHATSAALIDATREILMDSDFENAMKVLTSWIPVKDEDLLMKVAHAEWKLRKKRA